MLFLRQIRALNTFKFALYAFKSVNTKVDSHPMFNNYWAKKGQFATSSC